MDLQTVKNKRCCRQADISSYLDGELAPYDELVFEKHLAVCKICLDELNLQKKMLSALDFAFNDKEEIKLPENFAKVVATTAESGVSGLRLPEERFRALRLCAFLFLLVLIGLGFETGKVLTALTGFSDQVLAIVGLAFHLAYEFIVGICVIMRALSQQFISNTSFSFLLVFCVFIFSFIILSRLVIRYNRS